MLANVTIPFILSARVTSHRGFQMSSVKIEEPKDRISRKRFLRNLAVAGGLGAASLTVPESLIPAAHAVGTSDVAPASYIVENASGTITAYHCDTGSMDYSGTDAYLVIQSALDHLTPGRTWKEKVVLKGNFTFSNAILIPSYTILEILGLITPISGFPLNYGPVIVSGATDVEVIGGTVLMPTNNHSSALTIVDSSNVDVDSVIMDGQNYSNSNGMVAWVYANSSNISNVHFTRCRVQNAIQDGIQFGAYNATTMRNIGVHDSYFTNLYRAATVYAQNGTAAVYDVTISRNKSYLIGGTISGKQYLHYVLQRQSPNNIFLKATVTGNVLDGLAGPPAGGGIGIYSIGSVDVGHNIIDLGGTGGGPAFAPGRVTAPCQHVNIHDNIIVSCDSPMDFDSAFDLKFEDNIVAKGGLVGLGTGYGYHRNVTFEGNTVRNISQQQNPNNYSRSFIYLENGIVSGSPVTISLPDATTRTLPVGDYNMRNTKFFDNLFVDDVVITPANVLYSVVEVSGAQLQPGDGTRIERNEFIGTTTLASILLTRNARIRDNWGLNPGPKTDGRFAQAFVKAGAPSDADFDNPADGLVVVDTTNNKIWVRASGVWKGASVS